MKKTDFGHNGKPRICFVAHNAYGALAGKDTGHIGGIERQQSLMARWLVKRGYKVSMITWDEGQEDRIEIDGVRVFKMCRRDAGIKGLRFFWPGWYSLNETMERADADIYYQNCGGYETGQVVLWCRRHGRKSVYSVASDPDCDPRLPVLKPRRDRILYRYGLRHADRIVVQTHRQQKMLRDGFGIDSTMIPMPCSGFSSPKHTRLNASCWKSLQVLWVGRISKEKRLEWLLDVAERCPEITFDVVGAANTYSNYALALIRRAASIPNVTMHGRILHAEMALYYGRSKVLCCTSSYEGFPNTFLEAWSCGIPVVSTFDPDNVITKHNLGRIASSTDELVSAIQESINKPKRWQAASDSAREFFLKNHTPDSCMRQFAQVFQDISGSNYL